MSGIVPTSVNISKVLGEETASSIGADYNVSNHEPQEVLLTTPKNSLDDEEIYTSSEEEMPERVTKSPRDPNPNWNPNRNKI